MTKTEIKRDGHLMGRYITEIEPIPVDWDKRPITTVYNDKNELVGRTYGPTQEELHTAHKERKCGVWCEYCYNEAMLLEGVPFKV